MLPIADNIMCIISCDYLGWLISCCISPPLWTDNFLHSVCKPLNNRCVIFLWFLKIWMHFIPSASLDAAEKKGFCGSCGFGRIRSKTYFCFDWVHCLEFSSTVLCGISCAANPFSHPGIFALRKKTTFRIKWKICLNVLSEILTFIIKWHIKISC